MAKRLLYTIAEAARLLSLANQPRTCSSRAETTEIQAASAAFDAVDVPDLLPRLIMVRRAVEASFYTADLPLSLNAS